MSSPTERRVTFGAVLAVPEYRWLLAAGVLSWLGDVVAKAAVTYLVYARTGSVGWSAATFAVGYLAWVVGGPVLAALAERHDYRRAMVLCDLVRMVAIALVAVPGAPLPVLVVLVVLLFAVSVCTPPFEAARSALLPQLLDGERYVVAVSLQTVVFQGAQLAGYLAGGAVILLDPRLGLLVNAATFGLSALLIARGVRPRPAPVAAPGRASLLRDAADGFRVVFGQPVLRSIAVVVFATVLFTILPEGLAAGWTAQLGGGAPAQGLLMASAPVGAVLGGLAMGRLVPAGRRQGLIVPLAVACPLSLTPALADPPFAVVLAMSTLAMALGTGLVIAGNGLFVQVLPASHRARAFGVMQGGLYLAQGLAVGVAGALSTGAVSRTVGWWSVGGVALMAGLALLWPSRAETERAVAAASD